MPGRFIIDRSGIIRYAEVNPDYTVRPEPEETLSVLEKLRA
jgi:peroxiredoxin